MAYATVLNRSKLATQALLMRVDRACVLVYNYRMYKVKTKENEAEFGDLAEAMDYAKSLGILVTIEGNGMEIVGIFGADSIKDGKCPDGVDYTWMKRRSQ